MRLLPRRFHEWGVYGIMPGRMSFDERVQKHKERLSGASQRVIVELALTSPGGSMDAPFAPIDPALHAAAVELAREAHINLFMERLRVQ